MVNRIDIEVNAIGNFAQVKTQLAELKAAVVEIQSKPLLGNFGKQATMQIGAAQKAFDQAILSTRAFNVEMVKMSSHIDEFGARLQAGQLKFGEYFKLYRANIKGTASELDALASSQARVAKSMVIPDALRTGYARVITNTTADLKTLGAAEEAAAIKAKLLNTTIHGMGTQLVNLGKNTQWAGRQLSMGLTMPIVAFGAAAAKTFKDVNVELTKLQRLYGKGVTPPSDAAIKKISDQALNLGKNIAQTMGIAQTETVKTAANFAAIGLQGDKLLRATEQSMKLSKLGALTSEDAQKTVVAMQNVFKVSSTELPNAVNFLTSIQKQTSLSLQDMADAIPRVGPIIQQLGGSYKDAAVMMVAMKEAGIPAAQSANAIKSAVASMIAPTSAASDMFKKFGIDLAGIKNKSGGNPIQMIESLQSAMKGLEPLAKAQLIEKLFGKFQFARVTALMENLGKAGSQTQNAMAVAGASSIQLAKLTDQEMTKATESVSSKWQRAVEGMKAQLQPFGEGFVKFGTKIVNVIEKILSFLNKFKPLRNLLVTVLGGAALVGPLLMITGLIGNFVGSIVKSVAYVREFGRGMKDGGIKTALSYMADSWKMIDKGSLAATENADMFESSIIKSTEAFSTLNFEVEKLKDKLMAIATMTANGITTKFSPVAELGRYAASQSTLAEMQALHPFFGSGGTVKNIERPHMSAAARTWGGWQSNMGGIQQQQPGLVAFLNDPNRFPKGASQQEAWMKHGTSEQWGRPVPVGGLAGTLQKAYSDEPVVHGTKFGTTQEDVVARGMGHIQGIRDRIITGDIKADSLVAKELEKIDAMPKDQQEKELMKVIESVTFTEKQFFNDMIETFVQTKAILVSDEEKVAELDRTMKGILADSSIADKPAAFAAVMQEFNADFVNFGGTLVDDVRAYRQIVTQTIMAGQTEFETAIAAASLRAGLVTEAEMAGGAKLGAFGAFKSMDKHALEQSIAMGARRVDGFQRGGIPGFQSGVTSPWVPGSGSGDKIPALLEPGEFVINRNAAQKYGGLLTDINYNKAPRFQTGGGLPGFQEGVNLAAMEQIMSYRGGSSSEFPIGGKPFDPKTTYGMLSGENLAINNIFKTGDPGLRKTILNELVKLPNSESILTSLAALGNPANPAHQLEMANALESMWAQGQFDNISTAQKVQIATLIKAAQARQNAVSLSDVAPELETIYSKNRSGPKNKAWTIAKLRSALESLGGKPITEYSSLSDFRSQMTEQLPSVLGPIESEIGKMAGIDINDPETKRLVDLYVYGRQSTSRPGSFSPQITHTGGLPGFQSGVDLSAMPESWSKKYTTWTDALTASDLEARTGRFADLELTNIGSRVQDLSGMSSLIPGVNGVYEINGQKYVIKGHDTADSALIESRGTQLTRDIFGLNTPNQGFIKFAHPQTGQQMFGVMSPYDDTFANSTGTFGKDNAVNQMLAATIRRDKDLQADNFWQSIVGDVGAGFLGNKASQPRLRLDTPIVDLETQLRANLLMDKAGARRHGAEATAPIIKEMGAEGLTQKWQEAAKAALAKAEHALSNMPMMTPEEQKAYSYIIDDLRKASTMDMAPYFDAWASVEPQIKKPPTEKALATKEANKLKASMERATALEAGYPRWAMQTGGGIPGFTQGLTPLPMAGKLPSTIVYDIDKTLAGSVDFTRAAGQHTLDAWAAAAENAPVNSAELAKYNFLKSMGHKMAVVTARGERYDPMTLAWLKKNGIEFDEFISKPNGVTSSDPVFKRSVLEGMMGRANIAGFIDDKPANLRMASKLGIPAIEAISTMPKLQKGGVPGFSTGGNTIEDIWGDGQRTFRASQWQGPRLPIDYGFVTKTKELNRHPYFATKEEAEEYVRTEVAMKSLSGTEKNELGSLRQFVNDETNLNYLASVWQQGSAGIRNHPERLEALLSYFMPIKDAMTLRRKTVLGVPGEMPTEQQVSILDALSSGAYDSIIGKKINLTGTPSAYTEWGFDWLAAKDFEGNSQQREFRENQLTKAKEQLESAKRQVEALNDPNPQIADMSRRYLEDRFRGWTSRKGVPFEENVKTYLDMHERAIVSAQEDLAKVKPMGREPKDVMLQRTFKPGTSMLDITKINPNEKYRGTTLMEREWITGPGNPTIESVSQAWIPPSKMLGGQRAYQTAIEKNLFPYVLNMKQRGGIQGLITGNQVANSLQQLKLGALNSLGGYNATNEFAGVDSGLGLYIKQISNKRGLNLEAMAHEAVMSQLLRSGLFGENVTGPDQALFSALGKSGKLKTILASKMMPDLRAGMSLLDSKGDVIPELLKNKTIDLWLSSAILGNKDQHIENFGIAGKKLVGIDNTSNFFTDAHGKSLDLRTALNDFEAYSNIDEIGRMITDKKGEDFVENYGVKYVDGVLNRLESGTHISDAIAAATNGSSELSSMLDAFASRKTQGKYTSYADLLTTVIGKRSSALYQGFSPLEEDSLVFDNPMMKMQTGGTPWVPGSGDGDRIPAMLEPGEFVVNKNAAKQYGGLLNHLNWEAAPRFQQGSGNAYLSPPTGNAPFERMVNRVTPLPTTEMKTFSQTLRDARTSLLSLKSVPKEVINGMRTGFQNPSYKGQLPSYFNTSTAGGYNLGALARPTYDRLGIFGQGVSQGVSQGFENSKGGFQLGRMEKVPTGNLLPNGEPEMVKSSMGMANGFSGKLSYLFGRQARPGMGTMMGGQMAGMLGMQMAGGMQDGYAKSALNAASMGTMLGSMTPLGPIGGAIIGAIAGGAMKAVGDWKERIKNQSDLLTDSITVDSVAMQHLGITARDFSNIVYNASGKIVKASSEFQQGVNDYKTSQDPLIVSALKGLTDISQAGDLDKIKNLITSRFGGQLLATTGSPEARKKIYTDMQQFMVAGNVGTLTRQSIVEGFKNVKSPTEALLAISKNLKTIGTVAPYGINGPTIDPSIIGPGVPTNARGFIDDATAKKSASALWSMQTTSDPLQLGRAFDDASGKTKDIKDALNDSRPAWLTFKDIVQKADPAMAKLDTHMHNLGTTTVEVTRINSLYQAGLAKIDDQQLQQIHNNPELLSGLELEAAARQSVNSTFAEYLSNAQAHDAQMATQNSAAQKAADANQAEQDRINGLIDSANKYINSEQNKINKIQKEKSAYDSLMAAQEQSIQNENTLNNLKSAITRARAGGDLLAMADAQSNYNAELQKQADEKAKQAKDNNYNQMMEKHQNNIDGAQKKIDVYNAKLKDLEKASTSAAKVAAENWNVIASKATPATDAVNEINDAVYGDAMQGGWKNAKELYDKVLGEPGMKGKLAAAGMSAGDLKGAIVDFAKSASGTEMQNANATIGNFGDLLDGIPDKLKKVQVAQMLQATLTSMLASGKIGKADHLKAGQVTMQTAKTNTLSLIEDYYNIDDTNNKTETVKEGSVGYFNGVKVMRKGGKWVKYSTSATGPYAQLKKQPKKSDFIYTTDGGSTAYKLATGGSIFGPGGPKSDMIPAMLSNGEYVINAEAVNKYGTGFMDMVNAKKFANGGPVMNDYMKSDIVHHQPIDGWKWDKKQKKYMLPTVVPKSVAAINSIKPKNLTRMFDTSAINKSIRLSESGKNGTFNNTINDHTVYNITVNAKTNADPKELVKLITEEMKKANKSLGTSRKQGSRV